MTEIRPVDGEREVEAFLEIRRVADPERAMTRAGWDDSVGTAGWLAVLAWDGGVPVGGAFAERQFGDPESPTGWVSVRVLAAHRRRGHGSALLRHCSAHVRGFGGTELAAGTRADDVELLTFLAGHGFSEIGRRQDVALELATAEVRVELPRGIELVALEGRPEFTAGVHAVAVQADADVPASRPIVTGSLERWRTRNLGPLALPALSFAALAGGDVVGYAILGGSQPGEAEHWMTGVRRDWRGRGVARALKQAQIAAAREAGLTRLRTQNDLANAPMRRVNELLGYRAERELVDLAGPLL